MIREYIDLYCVCPAVKVYTKKNRDYFGVHFIKKQYVFGMS